MNFSTAFQLLTENEPFPWQEALYNRFCSSQFPSTACLPTGLGKTSVIAVWLIALATHSDRMPRRLVYVVNRRTVVDQTTSEVEKYRSRLRDSPELAPITDSLKSLCAFELDDESPLAISTLRGQFADNREWSTDPSRPAVICGTVDMIGSRLLFNGYGIGWKSRPLHAGFLAQDVLLVHDEAHLEQPFQSLLESLVREQHQVERTEPPPWKRLRVLELTATPRTSNASAEAPFVLTASDLEKPVVQQRVHATKRLTLHPLPDVKRLGIELADAAHAHHDSGAAILIFVRMVDDLLTVRAQLLKKQVPETSIALLTGTMRGVERDALVSRPIFQRFLGTPTTCESTVYLICTSAGEVGVNMSADHLVCDLTPFDSMTQRLGRLNRFGVRNDSTAKVFHPLEFDFESTLEERRARTLRLLEQLDGDASPHGLAGLNPDDRTAAFTPVPTILPVTEIHFDSWSLTSIRDRLPGRPAVEPYLHGVAEWDPPGTQVAWRHEVSQVTAGLLESNPATELLDLYPVLPHEVLKDRSDRVFDRLKKLNAARKLPEMPLWVVADDGSVDTEWTLGALVARDRSAIEGKLVLLPPEIGGLNTDGMLDPTSESATEVADIPGVRHRSWTKPTPTPEAPQDLPLIYEIDFNIESDDSDDPDAPGRIWRWYQKAPEGTRTTANKYPVAWGVHVADVVDHAKLLVSRLPLTTELREAVVVAAEFHDHGKRRDVFQHLLGNKNPAKPWAKSGNRRRWFPETYRHELGSIIDLQDPVEHDLTDFAEPLARFHALPEEMQELVFHLIATHHGWGRPHFSPRHAFDPQRLGAERVVAETPRRFARIQRRYGRWGLAYLESLLRAADWAASANPSKFLEDES